jgi:SAM-dependent methyltransferase
MSSQPATALRLHEIAEANHRILNPITARKLDLLGEICQWQPGGRLLDLACGKGEMLSQWAARYGIDGTGVDISTVFLDAARLRAAELGVADKITFVEGDAATYQASGFDMVSCLGATWIGNGVVGTINLMRPALAPDGLLLIGEPYWIDEPPEAAYAAFGWDRDEFTSLRGTLDRFTAAGCELVEMVLADGDSWDRYVASQWRTLSDWLRANPDAPEVPQLRAFLDSSRSTHLEFGRRYLGWGVFVLRPTR